MSGAVTVASPNPVSSAALTIAEGLKSMGLNKRPSLSGKLGIMEYGYASLRRMWIDQFEPTLSGDQKLELRGMMTSSHP